MTISIIAATAENNVIGQDNDLIWHISEDLKRFKALTSGKPIIMGRKTYESLPFKPLPKRKNIIISRKKNLDFKGAQVVSSIEKALNQCEEDDEVFICGGAEIYKQFMKRADRMFITKVYESFEGDTFFPEIDENLWIIENKSEIFQDEKSGIKFQFIDYIRKI